jgi:hypothetical protein
MPSVVTLNPKDVLTFEREQPTPFRSTKPFVDILVCYACSNYNMSLVKDSVFYMRVLQISGVNDKCYVNFSSVSV